MGGGRDVENQNIEGSERQKYFQDDQNVERSVKNQNVENQNVKKNVESQKLTIGKSNLSDFQILTTYGVSTYGILELKNQS